MAELADALALGASGRKAVQVQILFSAPASHSTTVVVFVGATMHAGCIFSKVDPLKPLSFLAFH